MKSQLYFWSSSDVIERRYYRGLHNLINLYMPLCDNWIIIDKMRTRFKILLQKGQSLIKCK